MQATVKHSLANEAAVVFLKIQVTNFDRSAQGSYAQLNRGLTGATSEATFAPRLLHLDQMSTQPVSTSMSDPRLLLAV